MEWDTTDFPEPNSDLESIDPAEYWTSKDSFESICEPSDRMKCGDQYSDEELDRDLGQRKHVNTANNADGMYGVNLHTDSNFARFPVNEGLPARVELCAYIKKHFSKQRFQDNYGRPCLAEDLEPGYMARLQAMLWQDIPRAQAAILPKPDHITGDDALAADVVMWIGNTLAQFPSVFIIQERKSRKAKCSNTACTKLHRARGIPLSQRSSEVIALEPLLDMATLEHVADLNHFNKELIVFRREDSKYSKMGFDINSIIPMRKTVFCIECLQFLWDQRVRAWAAKDKFSPKEQGIKATVNKPHMASLRGDITLEEERPLASKRVRLSPDEGSSPDVAYSKNLGEITWSPLSSSADTKIQPPQLDGVRNTQLGLRNMGSHNENEREVDICEQEVHRNVSALTAPAFTRTGFVYSRDAGLTANFALTISTNWTATNRQTMATSSTPDFVYPRLYNSGEEPEFTSDLERDSAGDKGFEGAFEFRPARKLSNSYNATTPGGSLLNVQHKCRTFPAPFIPNLGTVQSPSRRKARPEVKIGCVSRADIFDSAERAALGPRGSHRKSLSPRMTRSPDKKTAFTSFLDIDLSQCTADEVHDRYTNSASFAKRSIETTQPPFQQINKVKPLQISDHTRFPSNLVPLAIYCICRKPDDGSKMVQCANSDCPVSWYHYKCLDKGQKISSNHRKWTCEVCKMKQAYKEQTAAAQELSASNKAGNSFSDQEFLDFLSIPGPSIGVVDPYGLASRRPANVPPVDEPEVDMEEEDDYEAWYGEEGHEQEEAYEDMEE